MVFSGPKTYPAYMNWLITAGHLYQSTRQKSYTKPVYSDKKQQLVYKNLAR